MSPSNCTDCVHFRISTGWSGDCYVGKFPVASAHDPPPEACPLRQQKGHDPMEADDEIVENPWANDRRRHARVQLFATVTLKTPDETFILSVRDISLSGVFLESDGHDLSTVREGTEHDVVIADGENPDNEVAVRARVIRKTADGMALKWIGEDDMFKVAPLVDLQAGS